MCFLSFSFVLSQIVLVIPDFLGGCPFPCGRWQGWQDHWPRHKKTCWHLSTYHELSDYLLYMWLSHVCNFCNWCVINSHEQIIQCLHDNLQEQSEHDFGLTYFLVMSWLFPFFWVCFVLDLCCYLQTILHRFTWMFANF